MFSSGLFSSLLPILLLAFTTFAGLSSYTIDLLFNSSKEANNKTVTINSDSKDHKFQEDSTPVFKLVDYYIPNNFKERNPDYNTNLRLILLSHNKMILTDIAYYRLWQRPPPAIKSIA